MLKDQGGFTSRLPEALVQVDGWGPWGTPEGWAPPAVELGLWGRRLPLHLVAVLGSLLSSGPAIGKRSREQAELDAASVSGSDPHCVSTAGLMPFYVLSHFRYSGQSSTWT